MTTTSPAAVAPLPDATTTPRPHGQRPHAAQIPLARLVLVEVRKVLDTRAGAWLLAGIGICTLLAATVVIVWAPDEQLTYSRFTLAIGFPMSIILPIVAALAVTAEWSQRSGLTTFTLVPHRGRVLLAKAAAVTLVAIASTPVAFAVGALGNLAGAALAGVPTIWDQDLTDAATFALGNTLLLLVGFTLGALIRNSSGAVVAYMVYAFVAPGLLAVLAFNQDWFADARPWLDPKYNQDALINGSIAGDQWTQLAVTTLAWLVVPLAAAVVGLRRSEVK